MLGALLWSLVIKYTRKASWVTKDLFKLSDLNVLSPETQRAYVCTDNVNITSYESCSAYIYTTITNFSKKYLMICKIFTDVGGIN